MYWFLTLILILLLAVAAEITAIRRMIGEMDRKMCYMESRNRHLQDRYSSVHLCMGNLTENHKKLLHVLEARKEELSLEERYLLEECERDLALIESEI